MPPHFISTDLGPYPGLLQNEKPPSKTPNYKMKNQAGSRGINIGLLQNVLPKSLVLNFKIQHVTSCFVAGHFVAIAFFDRSRGGISFCSHMRTAPTFFLPLSMCRKKAGMMLQNHHMPSTYLLLDCQQKTTKCFPGQIASCYKMVCFSLM